MTYVLTILFVHLPIHPGVDLSAKDDFSMSISVCCQLDKSPSCEYISLSMVIHDALQNTDWINDHEFDRLTVLGSRYWKTQYFNFMFLKYCITL